MAENYFQQYDVFCKASFVHPLQWISWLATSSLGFFSMPDRADAVASGGL
jgi:hypothetical protein